MKKLFTLILAVAGITYGFAQGNIDQNSTVPSPGYKSPFKEVYGDPASLQKSKIKHTPNHTGGRSQNVSFYVDYGEVDNQYALQLGTTYLDDRIFELNRRLPKDSAGSLAWAYQWYPTLYDVENSTGWPILAYPPTAINMTIDTIVLRLAHDNVSNTKDTIMVSIWDFDAFTTFSIDSGVTGILYGRQTLITDTALTGAVPGNPGSYYVGGFAIAMASPVVIPAGKRFIVQVDYFGKASDPFFMVASRRNDCANTCASVPYVQRSWNTGIDSFNSLGAIRYVDPQGTQTGSYPTTFFYNDCNGNQAQDFDNCERFAMQNLAIYPHITGVIPNFYTDITANITAGCPNATVDLTASAAGSGATPYTYSWSIISGAGTGTLLTNTGPSVQFSIGAASGQVVCTVNDGASGVAKDTITINSRGFVAAYTAGAGPITQACGGSTTLQLALTGYTTGSKTYHWNYNNATTAQVTVGFPGNYCVTVTNSTSCTATACIGVQYPGNLTNNITFTTPDVSPLAGFQICEDVVNQFTNTSARQSGWDYIWTFGDQNTSSLQNGTNTYSNPGLYVVTLEQDSGGCGFISNNVNVNVLAASSQYCVTGVADLEFSNAITLMPNPTNGNINITVNGVEKNITINVYNILGAELMTYSANDVASSFNKTFDFTRFSNGTYLVKITSGDKTAVKRVTVSK